MQLILYRAEVPRWGNMATRIMLAWLLAIGCLHAGPLVSSVDTIGITVSDMDRSIAFYTQVLPFRKISDTEVDGEAYEHLTGVFGLHMRNVELRLGTESIRLIEYLTPRGRPIPIDSRSNDLWFQHIAIIVSDMDQAYAHLRKNKVTMASPSPQRLPEWNPNAGGIQAFYFRDPDDNHLEILQFPKGKGDPKWQEHSDQLFLGIDHTAIVVANTDISLRFYRDSLGLKVTGASENYGIEQERLNNVFGAHLRITALKASSGPGIELLEYLTPRTGRPMPLGTQANDLWHWQIEVTGKYIESIPRIVRSGNGTLISNSIVALPKDSLGATDGILTRDPDGHAVLFLER